MNRQIFESIRQLKHELIPNERLILFGSQARGDARPDSDWDLLLLLNKDKVTWEDDRQLAYPFTKLGWDYATYFSVKVYTEKEWQQKYFTPFYKNVIADGIEIK
ncbi:MAG: nucleotidyltransferase domain-containing protein [Tannerellaceae bacterium]|jgi:predicted nucleotidyltransferase|nr:nucleotidyltransferase domain-containing protein [Tannerellaceae bacterium]